MSFRRRSIPSLLVLLLVIALSACSKSPEEHLQQGKALFEKGDRRDAILELKNTLQAQPGNGEARLLLGKVYLANEAYAEAEKELSQARKYGIGDEQVLPLLAKALLKMGEPQKVLDLGIPPGTLGREALAALQAARAAALLGLGKPAEADQAIAAGDLADANHPDLLMLKARLALNKQRKPEAMQLLDSILRKDAKFTEALYLKAGLLRVEDKPDEAMKIYQRIIDNDPSQFQAHLAMSSLHLQAKNTEAADHDIKAAEKTAANNLEVKHARGVLELQRGNLDRAREILVDVLRAAPNHLPATMAYALVNYGLGNYEQSIKHAGIVLGAAPNNLLATKILVGSQLKIGDAQEALKLLNPLLPQYPGDSKLLALTGEAYLHMGDYSKAMGYLDKAAALNPGNATIKTQLAAGHLATGNSAEALADLEAAANLSAKPGQDLALVILHLQGKEYDKALQALANLEKKLPNNPVTHNLRAVALVGKQDMAGARKALEQALTIQPSFYPAAANLARLDLQDKKPEAARTRFESVLAADKNNVKAMMALADMAMDEKNETVYVDWLEKAAKADPKDMQPPIALVSYYLNKKDNRKALALALNTSHIHPDSLRAMDLLGSTQLATGNHSTAIATFRDMVRKSPRSPDVLLRLAMTQAAANQLGEARATLQQALQLKPGFAQAQGALIRLELADKKPEAALQIARQIQAQQPKSPLGFDREADIHMSQKRFPPAVKAYEQALTNGAGSSGLVKLHRALFMAGDIKSAEQRLNAWLKQYPKDAVVHAYAAEYFIATQRDREAIVQYEELLKLVPQDVLAQNNLASLYQRAKDSRALSVAEQAYKLAPDNPAVQDTLGWILVEQGQLPRAVELLRKAVSKAPKIGSIRYHYAVALARTGNKTEARKTLESFVGNDQKYLELDDARALLKSF